MSETVSFTYCWRQILWFLFLFVIIIPFFLKQTEHTCGSSDECRWHLLSEKQFLKRGGRNVFSFSTIHCLTSCNIQAQPLLLFQFHIDNIYHLSIHPWYSDMWNLMSVDDDPSIMEWNTNKTLCFVKKIYIYIYIIDFTKRK